MQDSSEHCGEDKTWDAGRRDRKPGASSPPVAGGSSLPLPSSSIVWRGLAAAPAAPRSQQRHPAPTKAVSFSHHLLGCCFQQVTAPLLPPGFIVTDLTVPLTHNSKMFLNQLVPRTPCDDKLSHLRLQLPSPFGVCTSFLSATVHNFSQDVTSGLDVANDKNCPSPSIAA